MNRNTLALALFASLVTLCGTEVKLESFGVPRVEKRRIVSERSGIAVQVRAPTEEDVSRITVVPEKEGLVVDASKLDRGKKVMVLFGVVTPGETVKNQSGKRTLGEPFTRLEVEFTATANVKSALLFEGQNTDSAGKRKHFWGQRPVLTDGKRQIVQFDKVFPETSSITRHRVDVPGGSRFQFHRAAFLRMEQ